MTDKAMMVVVRVSEMPESPVPSVERECDSCHKPVWVSKLNAEKAPDCELICPPCLNARATTSPN